MKLPEYFEEKFKDLMDADEYALFKRSFDDERANGLRLNTLKIDPASFESLFEGSLAPIPWIPEGYYYEDLAPGKHPYYHAGLYYIQEPSAMMPAQILSPKPGERVLDLCAAPGENNPFGLHDENSGLIVSNDISPKRIKALVKNVEFMGITNTLWSMKRLRGWLMLFLNTLTEFFWMCPVQGRDVQKGQGRHPELFAL